MLHCPKSSSKETVSGDKCRSGGARSRATRFDRARSGVAGYDSVRSKVVKSKGARSKGSRIRRREIGARKSNGTRFEVKDGARINY